MPKRFRPPLRAKNRSVLVLAEAVVIVPFCVGISFTRCTDAPFAAGVDVLVAQHCKS